MPLSILNVDYPLAPVGPDAVGGAEQVLSTLDHALVALGHRSIVVAREGSCTFVTLVPVAAEDGPLDETAQSRAQSNCRRAIAAALQRWPIDLIHLHGVDFHRCLPDTKQRLVTLHLPLDHYPPEVLSEVLSPQPGLWFHAVSMAQHQTAPCGSNFLKPIANGVDTEAYATRQPKRDFVLLLGRICPEKGIHLALDAA